MIGESMDEIDPQCQVVNEDVVGAAPTDDAPTTSRWSTISLPNKVRLILEVWGYHVWKLLILQTNLHSQAAGHDIEKRFIKYHMQRL